MPCPHHTLLEFSPLQEEGRGGEEKKVRTQEEEVARV
jgi:hypothetical protein